MKQVYIKSNTGLTGRIASLVSALAAGVALIAAPCVSAQTTERPDSQFNALDYVLQKPAPARLFEKKSFADHMEIGIEGGATIMRRSDGTQWRPVSGKPGYRAGVTLGDWVTPVHGWRVGFNAGRHRSSTGFNPYFVGVSADYMMNLTSLALGYDPERVFELIGTAGAEYQRLYAGGNWSNTGGLRIGLQARFNVSPSTFLYVEPRFGVYSDKLDGGWNWQRYDWEASVMLGLGYRVIWGPARYRGRWKFETNGAVDNLFYGVQGGLTAVAHSDLRHDKRNRIGVQGSAFVGKWFTAASGLRLAASLGTAGKQNGAHRKYTALELDYMLNLNSAFNGYRPGGRFESNLAVGPALIYANGGSRKFYPALGAGWQLMWNTGSGFGVFIEPHAMLVSKKFWAGRRPASGPFDVFGQVNIGFQYRIDGYNRLNNGYSKSTDWQDYLQSNRYFMTFGAGMFTTHRSFRRSIATYGALGKWFTPYSAWRLGLDYEYDHKPVKLMSFGVDLDYMLSLSSISAGFNPDRVFDLSGVVGVQAGASHNNAKNHFFYGFKGGLHGSFNLSRNISLFIEPEFLAQHIPHYKARTFTPQFRVLAGLTYKLGAPRDISRTTGGSDENRNFLSVSGGPSMFSETLLHPKENRVGGGIDIAVGHRFSRCSSFQLGYGYDRIVLRRASDVGVSTAHLDYMLDLTQLFDYNPDRVFSITPRVGAGIAWSSQKGAGTGWAALGAVRFGWNLPYNLGLYVEPSMTLWDGKMCKMGPNSHDFVGVGRIGAGVTFGF